MINVDQPGPLDSLQADACPPTPMPIATALSHTAGPWTFDHDWHRIPTVVGANGQNVAYIEKRQSQRAWPDLPERGANAHLISLAPEMLAGLRVFVKAFEFEHPGVESRDEEWIYDEHRAVGLAYLKGRALIAKANGGGA